MISTRKATILGGSLLIAAGLLIPFEGRHTSAYLDPVAVPTICYGHTDNVKLGDVASEQICLHFLQKDLEIADKAITRLVHVPLHPDTRAALISFVYNVGEGNFARSTLLRKLNSGDIPGACNELPRWVYAKGQVLRGLIRRRDAERQLCLQGV